MKCLIIAAGRGSRLSSKVDSKPLTRLLGVSLIERVILTAQKSGLTDFYVVTGYNGLKVRQYLDRFSQARNTSITHLVNDEWQKGNGVSVLKAKGLIRENFILLMADHVISESALVNLTNERIEDGNVLMVVDYGIRTNGLVDDNDATKVLVEDRKILDIGKNINNYNAYDTGIFLCSPALLPAIEESLCDGDESLSGGIRVLAQKGKAETLDIKGGYWIDVDDKKTFSNAEKKLLSTLSKTSDGPISTYINRPISRRITRHLLSIDISPMYVTLFSFILSLVGGVFFLLGGYVNLVIGGLLSQIASIIDGCDGEMARLKFQVTEFSGWLDAVLDRYSDAFILFALGYHVYSADGSVSVLFVCFLAIVGSFMNSYTADKYDGIMMRKLGPGKRYFRMGRDVRIFIVFLGVLGNQPFLVLAIIALLMNLENFRRVVVLYRNG
ncbi:MAG: NTP transferase domain-containing protein [Ignavibacteria bacterium]|nr:NTP transferase domain-containing protein [Ignavibacteria bacterium]